LHTPRRPRHLRIERRHAADVPAGTAPPRVPRTSKPAGRQLRHDVQADEAAREQVGPGQVRPEGNEDERGMPKGGMPKGGNAKGDRDGFRSIAQTAGRRRAGLPADRGRRGSSSPAGRSPPSSGFPPQQRSGGGQTVLAASPRTASPGSRFDSATRSRGIQYSPRQPVTLRLFEIKGVESGSRPNQNKVTTGARQ